MDIVEQLDALIGANELTSLAIAGETDPVTVETGTAAVVGQGSSAVLWFSTTTGRRGVGVGRISAVNGEPVAGGPSDDDDSEAPDVDSPGMSTAEDVAPDDVAPDVDAAAAPTG